jgi:hypothetical protein
MYNLMFLFTKTISKLFYLSSIFAICLITFSCESDDNSINDATEPLFTELSTELSSAPGLEFFIVGNITDDKGIKSIKITYESWFLDKTITPESNSENYELNYKFLVPEDEILGSSHTIMVSITDLGDNAVSREVTVVLDTDTTNPEIEIMSPLSGSFYENGTDIPIEIQVSDNFELQSLQVMSSALNLNETTEFSNAENNFTYSNTITVPDNFEGVVSIEATVTDAQGNTQTDTVTINVGAEVVYTDMYIVGGSTWFGWDPTKATRMIQDPNDEDWFEVEIYYSTGNNIKFIGQLDWAPNNWGLDPNDNTQMINSEDSEAIGFPEGNGYYRIRFNPYTLQYTYETMTVNVQQRNEMYVMGTGYTNYSLNWNPADGIAMVQNPNNPYQFSIDIEFSDAVDLKYLGQNDGWGPYDCGFEVGGETTIPVNYVKNQEGDGTADIKFIGISGNYRIIFDYFLLRTSVQPID